MLSSQTKDPVTHEATMNLRRNLKGGLCLEGILSARDQEIQVRAVTIIPKHQLRETVFASNALIK